MGKILTEFWNIHKETSLTIFTLSTGMDIIGADGIFQ